MSRARREDHEVAVAFAKYAKLRYREFQKLKRSQKDCPYCHGGEKHKALYIKDNKARRIVLNIKNDKHHPHSIAVWYKDFTIGDDYEPGGWIVKNAPLKYWTSINYCPMCGRKLGNDDD